MRAGSRFTGSPIHWIHEPKEPNSFPDARSLPCRKWRSKYVGIYEILQCLKSSQGFPDHPHRGQATVTYMLEGLAIFSIKCIHSF